MNNTVLRIAIIGPESSGKSSLCEQLARHYQTNWVKEYSRTYLPSLSDKYTLNDIIKIYTTQFEIEQKQMLLSTNLLFIDTEFIIAKVWCEHAFGECPDVIEQHIKQNPYDFYLLTFPDLPWVNDPLRENPGKGPYFFDIYEKLLIDNKFNYGVVKGKKDARVTNAIQLLETFRKKANNLI